jgi:hypothetical protein
VKPSPLEIIAKYKRHLGIAILVTAIAFVILPMSPGMMTVDDAMTKKKCDKGDSNKHKYDKCKDKDKEKEISEEDLMTEDSEKEISEEDLMTEDSEKEISEEDLMTEDSEKEISEEDLSN